MPSLDTSTEADTEAEPWLELDRLIADADERGLVAFLESVSTGDKARAISRLAAERQRELFVLLSSALLWH